MPKLVSDINSLLSIRRIARERNDFETCGIKPYIDDWLNEVCEKLNLPQLKHIDYVNKKEFNDFVETSMVVNIGKEK